MNNEVPDEDVVEEISANEGSGGPEEPKAPLDPREYFPEEAELAEGPFGQKKMVRLKDKTYAEKHGHADKTHAARIRAVQRAGDILEKKLKGWSLRQIAYEYDVSPGTIHRILVKEVEKQQKKTGDSADQVRFMMEQRLEFMWKSIYNQMNVGNTKAIDMGLRIMERQAKLFGLDAPEKKQIDLNLDMSDIELVAMARRVGVEVPPELEALAQTEEQIPAIEYKVDHEQGYFPAPASSRSEETQEEIQTEAQEGQGQEDG